MKHKILVLFKQILKTWLPLGGGGNGVGQMVRDGGQTYLIILWFIDLTLLIMQQDLNFKNVSKSKPQESKVKWN